MLDLTKLALDSLPSRETDDIEYKSSQTPENELKHKIQHAASAFWNSGGGVLLAGVNDKGSVDGGINTNVGRQTRDDWLAQILTSIRPTGRYTTREFTSQHHSSIAVGKCVFAVQFSPSSAIPHQSFDHKYYIRAGAHTVSASHDIVEALHAKRHFRNPRLVHLTRLVPFARESDFLHIEIIAATDAVALDVEIDLSPAPLAEGFLKLPLLVPIIDRNHSFEFRFEDLKKTRIRSTLEVKYRVMKDDIYSYSAQVDSSNCMSQWNTGSGAFGEITRSIDSLAHIIEGKDIEPRFK
ncbi:MAG: ATP-binding protein [Planctomycetes bacterium]|nr:ATP-binding protein [Planctomycetota bacterium]